MIHTCECTYNYFIYPASVAHSCQLGPGILDIDHNPASVAQSLSSLHGDSWQWYLHVNALINVYLASGAHSCRLGPGILDIDLNPASVAQSLSPLHWDSWQWQLHVNVLIIYIFFFTQPRWLAHVGFDLDFLILLISRLWWHSRCQLCTGILGYDIYVVLGIVHFSPGYAAM